MTTDPAAMTADSEPAPSAQPRRVPVWLGAVVGVAAALLGLLPWLATGMRLPLQNLWDAAADPAAMPVVMLPFSQYYLTILFGLIATGAVVAGIAARALRPRLPRGGFVLVLCGVVVTQLIAIVQTALVVERGLQERSESILYLVALVVVCVLSMLIGVGALALVARAPRAGALIGLTLGAIAVGEWLSAWLRPFLVAAGDLVPTLAGLLPWVPAVLVGVAIAWAGIGSIGRVVAALASLVLLWIAPALMTGVSSAAGSRVLAGYPAEMLDYAWGVFGMALFVPAIALRPIVTAITVAAVGLGARWALARIRRDS